MLKIQKKGKRLLKQFIGKIVKKQPLQNRLAARNLVYEVLSLHDTNAGKFLKHVREVNSLTTDTKTDFGDPSHLAHSKLFYYETAHLHCFQPTKLTCLLIENVVPTSDQFVNSEPIPLDEQEKAHISDGSACTCMYVTQ